MGATEGTGPMRWNRGELWWRLSGVAFWVACLTALCVSGARAAVFWLLVSCCAFFGIALSYRGGARVLGALVAAGVVLALDRWLDWSPLWGNLGLALALIYALGCYIRGPGSMWPGD
jgi:hypothetical protein